MNTYGLNDISSLVIDRQFVLIDKSYYQPEAYKELLNKVDAAGAVAFIINDTDNYKPGEFSYTTKVYGQGNYFSDFNDLKYFSKITVNDSNIIAPGPASTLNIIGKGNTNVSTLNNSIIINTDINAEYSKLENKISYVNDIVSHIEQSYTSFTYIHNNYQEILKGGSYISINDNIVNAYGLLSTDNFNDIISEYYNKKEIDNKHDELYDFVLQGYYNKPSINILLNNLKESIVGNSIDEFNTLEKISNWLKPSISYTLIKRENIDLSKPFYEYDIITNSYILANELSNSYYYQTVIKNSGYILSYISYLINDGNNIHQEIGKPVSYTYTNIFGTTYHAFGEISYYNNNLVDTYGNILTRNDSTGIYKIIDDIKISINNDIDKEISEINDKITNLYNQSLFNLNTYSYTSYIELSFDKYTHDNNPNRTLELRMHEANYEKPTNIINKNGLTTAYTVSDMIDYRMEWIKIK